MKGTLVLGCFSQTKNIDIPIKKYNVIQTGPKSQFGGLKEGLTNDAYQVGIADDVNIEPIPPAN